MTTNEGRDYFALDGDDFDPQELTKFLGVEPTTTKLKGSIIPGRIPKTNIWELSTDNVVNDYIDVYEMSTELINKLLPIKNLLIEAIDRFNVLPRFEVVLWFSRNEEHSTPAIGFDADTIKFLGEIGAFIDIDTYKL